MEQPAGFDHFFKLSELFKRDQNVEFHMFTVKGRQDVPIEMVESIRDSTKVFLAVLLALIKRLSTNCSAPLELWTLPGRW